MTATVRYLVLGLVTLLLTGCRLATIPVEKAVPYPSIESMVYPIAIFPSGGYDVDIVKTSQQLGRVPDHRVKSLAEEQYVIVDSAGMAFSIRNVRQTTKSPSLLALVFDGSKGNIVGVNMSVAPEGMVTSRRLWDVMESQQYTLRKCGVGPQTPPRELMRARTDWKCATQ